MFFSLKTKEKPLLSERGVEEGGAPAIQTAPSKKALFKLKPCNSMGTYRQKCIRALEDKIYNATAAHTSTT